MWYTMLVFLIFNGEDSTSMARVKSRDSGFLLLCHLVDLLF